MDPVRPPADPKPSARTVLFAKTDAVRFQVIRSVLSSNAGFLADFAALAALVELAGIPYLYAQAASFVLGASIVYALNAAWVFTKRRFASRRIEYAIFIAMSAAGLALNTALIWFFTERLGTHYLVSKVVCAIVVFVANFLSRKLVLFSAPTDPPRVDPD